MGKRHASQYANFGSLHKYGYIFYFTIIQVEKILPINQHSINGNLTIATLYNKIQERNSHYKPKSLASNSIFIPSFFFS